jgi:acetyl-CoA C-acetyltransferase
MGRVYISGVGITKFGELWSRSYRELVVEAGLKALEDAGLPGESIECLYLSSMGPGMWVSQEHVGPMVAEQTGLTPIPVVRVESGCASGALALHQAFTDVSSGRHKVVVVGGVEKMTDVGAKEASAIVDTMLDHEWESIFGATLPSLYAMMARRHMHEYGTTREQLAEVAVKNHHNGSLNPIAQFGREITIDHVLSSPPLAEPLRMLDCAPLSDGSAALVLSAEGEVEIAACEMATSTLALHSRDDITTMDSVVRSSKKAYMRAGIEPKDVDVAELHDYCTIGEIIESEDLGFFRKGEGGKMVEDGETSLEGSIPINTSGGLKCRGHPIGATGVAQVVEIYDQLMRRAGQRQIESLGYGLCCGVGGSGGSAVVSIFRRR